MAVVVLAIAGKAVGGVVGAAIGPCVGRTVEMQVRPEAPIRRDDTPDAQALTATSGDT